MLPVVELFHSLQGEGAHAGRSAFFIRLASCQVGCPWCDTKNSWSKDNHPEKNIMYLSEEAAKARAAGAAFVVITGGEPLHHNLDPLCTTIRQVTTSKEKETMPIHIETSGVDLITGNPNWITLSPKRHSPPRQEALQRCHELKVVIHGKDDLIFAEAMKLRMKRKNKPLLFLQPGWNCHEGQKLAFEFVKSHPIWRLSMQTHKWLGVS